MLKALRSFLVGYGVMVITGIGLITGGILLRPKLMRDIFAANGFTPHGYCLLWEPGLVWLYVVSDTLIGVSYVAISFLLAFLVHKARHEIPFHRVFLAFGAFIIACGSTHFMDVWTLWTPTYWLAGSLKLVTAVASVATAIALPPFLPKALTMITEAKVSRERKRELEAAHAELELLYEQTTELDRLKTEFFANVSHELRTPLTLILGPIEQLLAADNLTATQRHDLSVVERNARTLLKHVNDLLDVAKLDAGKMEIQRTEVDLAQLVRLTASHFDSLAYERQVSFTTETPSTLTAQIDTEKFQRVCLNLFANAFKFTPAGGTIRCHLRAEGERAILSVEDNGPGVPPELRDVIFEPFRQGDSSATRRFGGTGLGLAITKQFVELHGGTVVVEDAPSGGARFQIELPLIAASSTTIQTMPQLPDGDLVRQAITELRPHHADPNIQPAQAEQGIVLVVEDNPDMRRFLIDTLAQAYRVVAAEDGVHGLEQAVALRPDLIISDVMMPRMSGDVFVRAIREQPKLDAVPIVVLTARANDDLRVDLLRAGAQDYLIKPFSVAELRARVDNLIAIKQTREVLQVALEDRSQSITALANQISSRTRELEQALKVRDVFLSIASHELKTPLTALLWYTELLQRRAAREQTLNERDQRTVQAIVEQAYRLNKLILTLLYLTRIQSGELRIERQSLDLVPLVQWMVEDIRPTTKQHTITIEVPAEPVLVDGDTALLEQVCYSLLQNAVKYSPDGGPISVRVEAEQHVARIVVADQGMGIPDRALAHIFECFYRADTIDPQHISGFGIGLYLVKEIMTLHGGHVEVQSSEGRGSTFAVVMPLAATSNGKRAVSALSADDRN
jgi:signal transduction histidine kinase